MKNLYGEKFQTLIPTYNRKQVKALQWLASLSNQDRTEALLQSEHIEEMEPLKGVPLQRLMYTLHSGQYVEEPDFEDYLCDKIQYWESMASKSFTEVGRESSRTAKEALEKVHKEYLKLKKENRV
ncbi:hypothetical protein Goe16_02050 [Bacillus phage vB_BsuM-Goe16]|nr:hypothetical protein Goe16_00110 [Bacillus phage vB_BsuM-Goe16]WCS68619.1 hypothetical protein Goe16_02050 [Bacillus phage vB_BsuM-Goe16]